MTIRSIASKRGEPCVKRSTKWEGLLPAWFLRAISAGWKSCGSNAAAANDIHSSTVEGADGTDGARPYISILSSTEAGAPGTDGSGTRPYTWHSVFVLCPYSKMEQYLKLKVRAHKHRRKVNGLFKRGRNLLISDQAD